MWKEDCYLCINHTVEKTGGVRERESVIFSRRLWVSDGGAYQAHCSRTSAEGLRRSWAMIGTAPDSTTCPKVHTHTKCRALSGACGRRERQRSRCGRNVSGWSLYRARMVVCCASTMCIYLLRLVGGGDVGERPCRLELKLLVLVAAQEPDEQRHDISSQHLKQPVNQSNGNRGVKRSICKLPVLRSQCEHFFCQVRTR